MSEPDLHAIQQDVDKQRYVKNPWQEKYINLATSAFGAAVGGAQDEAVDRAESEVIAAQFKVRTALVSAQINTLSKEVSAESDV
eukprot:20864-Heterococcus_DN1.PRE.3